MSLPPVNEVRQRIEQVREETLRNLLKSAYLFCARIGEVVHYTYASDVRTGTTGHKLHATEEEYAPNLLNPNELATLTMIYLMQGRDPTVKELAKIKEPVAVFKVYTEKRKGLKHVGIERAIALPLNPEYEPWTKELLDYFRKRQVLKQPIFPFSRQKAYQLSKPTFEGLTLKIDSYRKQVGKDAEGKPITKLIPEHTKPFSLHSLRKMRENDLEENYGFNEIEVSDYGGWTLQSRVGTSSSLSRYRRPRWQRYFPKLLRKRS